MNNLNSFATDVNVSSDGDPRQNLEPDLDRACSYLGRLALFEDSSGPPTFVLTRGPDAEDRRPFVFIGVFEQHMEFLAELNEMGWQIAVAVDRFYMPNGKPFYHMMRPTKVVDERCKYRFVWLNLLPGFYRYEDSGWHMVDENDKLEIPPLLAREWEV